MLCNRTCTQVADNKYQLLQMNLCDGIMLQEEVDDQGDKLAIAINHCTYCQLNIQ